MNVMATSRKRLPRKVSYFTPIRDDDNDERRTVVELIGRPTINQTALLVATLLS